jgi:hypothetical protein
MRRRPVLVVLLSLAMFSGGMAVATAATGDPCNAKYTANSIAALHAYDECRFDRLEAKVDALKQVGPTATPSPTATSPKPTPSVTPTSASPTPTVTPSSTPTVAGFPDASTTGVPAGTVLKRVPQDATSGTGWHWDTRGWVEIDGAGAVFSGFQVTGTNIDISASNVTVSNSEVVNGQGGWGITLRHATGVTLDRNTIRGTSASDPGDNAIRDIYGDADGVKITGNNVYWWGSGINHFDAGGLIQGNYIHDLKNDSTGQQHLNGIQLGSGRWPVDDDRPQHDPEPGQPNRRDHAGERRRRADEPDDHEQPARGRRLHLLRRGRSGRFGDEHPVHRQPVLDPLLRPVWLLGPGRLLENRRRERVERQQLRRVRSAGQSVDG